MTPVEHQAPNDATQQQLQHDTWLITPLPSLVSLSTSQRSIVDSGALENLLIEHPSMSVFISVGEDDLPEEPEVTWLFSSTYCFWQILHKLC